MTNSAVTTNPPNSDITINNRGSDWLWAVFAVMLVSDLGMLAWTFIVPKGRRTFHYLSVFILTTASIAYFAMASDLGGTPIPVEYRDVPYTRSIWYARYIDWTITTPCLLLELVLATGLPLSDIIALLYFDIVMIVVGLIGALVSSSYKWGFFAFGVAALVYIWAILLGPALRSSAALGPEYSRSYLTSTIVLSTIWALYPICWGLADGGNVITPDGEMIFYGILDILAKPVFTYMHVFLISRLDYTALQLQSGKFSEGASLITRDSELANMHAKNARANQTSTTATPSAHTGNTVGATAPRGSDTTAIGSTGVAGV